MELRKGCEEDIPACVALSKIPEFTISTETDEEIADYIRNYMGKGHFIVAEENGVIGFAMGVRFMNSFFYLDGITVKEDWRGKGIGSQLLARMEAIAKEDGAPSMYMTVIDSNDGARRLYERKNYHSGKKLIEYEKML